MGELLFGKYEVLRPIGSGGFSSVYLVKDMHLNKLRAVKKYTSSIGLETEVSTLKELQHKGLPIVYDYREKGEDKYLVMEYVEGMSLREYLTAHKVVPLGIAIKWIGEIAEILEYLHGCNPAIIYRDLKPENIMIKNDGHIKLIDFGGVLLRSNTSEISNCVCGTKGYSAPELLKGSKIDFSADVYSVGVVLCQMLTGNNSVSALGDSEGLFGFDRVIPKGIKIVISNCLRKKPSERYQTMSEFMKDLNNYKRLVMGKEIIFFAKKLTVTLAYLAFLLSMIIPFIDGVEEDKIPFPFLYRPLGILIVAVVLNIFLLNKKGMAQVKVMKSVLLTQKKNSGLLFGIFFALGLSLGLMVGMFGNTVAYADVHKIKDTKELWVDLCDTAERKMLLKNDAVYKIEDKVRFEIPKNSMPDEDVKIQITAFGKDGREYVSRFFNVSNKSD